MLLIQLSLIFCFYSVNSRCESYSNCENLSKNSNESNCTPKSNTNVTKDLTARDNENEIDSESNENDSDSNSEEQEDKKNGTVSSKENEISSGSEEEDLRNCSMISYILSGKHDIANDNASGEVEDRNAPTNSTIEDSDREYQADMTGEESDENPQTFSDYPYTVSVQRMGAHYATGALVGQRWVLSTAEEFYNVRESIRLYRVRVGSVDCKKGGVVLPVRSIHIHPSFKPGHPAFDIAVLRLVSTSTVLRPIELSKVQGKVISAKFSATYWPRIVVKGTVLPPTAKERIKHTSMRVSTQQLIPADACFEMIGASNPTLNEASLCLQHIKAHHSDCMPDAGAPVTAEDGLWGITSGWVSPSCSSQSSPTLVTRVSTPEVRHWIEEQLHP